MRSQPLSYEDLLYKLVRIQSTLMKQGFELPVTIMVEKEARILVTVHMDEQGHCSTPFNSLLKNLVFEVFSFSVLSFR